jgi:hypothetical protein
LNKKINVLDLEDVIRDLSNAWSKIYDMDSTVGNGSSLEFIRSRINSVIVDVYQEIESINEINKCTFCGRESSAPKKYLAGYGYTILEDCEDCEEEIKEGNDI